MDTVRLTVIWDACPLIALAEGRTEEGAAGFGLLESPYAMMGMRSLSSFGQEELCQKPPPAPTSIGEGKPSTGKLGPVKPAAIASDLKRYALYGTIGIAGAAALYLALRPRS